jgi:hypothetical protein
MNDPNANDEQNNRPLDVAMDGAVGTEGEETAAIVPAAEDVDYESLLTTLLETLFLPSDGGDGPTMARKISEQDDAQTTTTFQRILEILKLRPEYALHNFSLHFEGRGPEIDNCLPIQACLAAGVSIEKLAELHDLNPETITFREIEGNSFPRNHASMPLLHFACLEENRSAVDETGILQLANRWPALVGQKERGSYGLYPLTMVLGERKEDVSLALVESLYNHFPSATNVNECDQPLIVAIQQGCRIEVIRFLVDKFPKEAKELTVNSDDFFDPGSHERNWQAHAAA